MTQVSDFLNWLDKDNFTLLGYREYRIGPVKGDYQISGIDDSSLGLMRRTASRELMLSELPESGRKQALSQAMWLSLLLVRMSPLLRI